LTGLAIALAGAFLPARRAARSRTAEILRSE
jgi:ABC-type antimicrobial peptide transport system permease subunit